MSCHFSGDRHHQACARDSNLPRLEMHAFLYLVVLHSSILVLGPVESELFRVRMRWGWPGGLQAGLDVIIPHKSGSLAPNFRKSARSILAVPKLVWIGWDNNHIYQVGPSNNSCIDEENSTFTMVFETCNYIVFTGLEANLCRNSLVNTRCPSL